MLVRHLMNQHPVMVGENALVGEVRQLMAQQVAPHVPVVDESRRLKGLVTRDSLMINPDVLGSLDVCDLGRYVAELKIHRVMIKAKDTVTTDPDQPIEMAAQRMVDGKVGCLPVVEGDAVVGLITSEDLLASLTGMMMSDTPAVRATLVMPMRKGELAKLVEAISDAGWGILAMGGGLHPKYPGRWMQVVKIRYVTLEEVRQVLSAIPEQELIDIRQM